MQMAAIAERSMAERLAEFEALNRAGNQMEADGIRRANPEFTDQQVFLTMVRRRYGDELARQVWPELNSAEACLYSADRLVSGDQRAT